MATPLSIPDNSALQKDVLEEMLSGSLMREIEDLKISFADAISRVGSPTTATSVLNRSGLPQGATGETLGERSTRRESISRDFTASRWRINRRDMGQQTPMANTGLAATNQQPNTVYAGLKI